MAQRKSSSRSSSKTRKSTSRSSKSGRSSSRSRSTGKKRSSSGSRSAQREPLFQLSRHQWAIIVGIILIALAGIAILSGLALSEGTLTRWLWNNIWTLFGYGGVLTPVILGGLGLYLVLWGMEQPPKVPWDRVAGFAVLFLALEGVLHWVYIFRHPEAVVYEAKSLQAGGGYPGAMLVAVAVPAVGRWATLVLCIALAGVGLALASQVTFAQIWGAISKSPGRLRQLRRSRPATGTAGQPMREPKPVVASPVKAQAKTDSDMPAPEVDEEPPVEASEPGLFYGDAVQMAAANYRWQLPAVADMLEPGDESAAADAQIRERAEIIEHTLRSFGAPGRIVEVNRGPVITQYGVEPLFIEQRNGRRVKVKVGQINSLADDLALALAARSIRIEAPVPGKGYIGIEVPNAEASLVSLRDVMEADSFVKIKSQLRIGLGQDVSGHAIAADLAQMPHLLIAGATGSGKSVCVNSIVACMLLQNSPEQLRLLMVDPKRVELTNYNGIPHLMMPVIVELDKVVAALQWVTREMDGRYRKFAEMGARNIADYNRRAKSDKKTKLPYIVVVIDELADLMMMAPDETERTVCRLAQMARATGIHLLIATQRPSVDVVTGLIKANFPARVAFAVASSTDSRVILDTTGAERLLGQGDMLLMSSDSPQPLRMQGCFVSDKELGRLVDFWRRQRLAAVQAGRAARTASAPPAVTSPEVKADPDLQSDLQPDLETDPEPATLPTPSPSLDPDLDSPLQQPLWEEVLELEKQAAEQDELFDDAVAIVRELGKASVSLLQRRLRIGYTRSARLIDDMEARGVVGPHPGGSRQREVLAPTPAGSEDAEPSG